MACCCVNVNNAANVEGMISRPFIDDKLLASYMRELVRARWVGRIIGVLHTFCSILAFCNLTWATVVLLGAFVSYLAYEDYYIVFTLLLLEASRLASASFFTQLLNRSSNPGHFSSFFTHYLNRGAQQSNLCSILYRLLSPVIQVLLIAPSFALSIYRSFRVHYPNVDSTRHLQSSIRIFYSVVIANAAISTLVAFFSSVAWFYFEQLSEKSVLKYYDEILNNTLMKGAVNADGFNFFHFALGLLGRDYASYKPWESVVKENKKLLRYLYAHKQGADYLQAGLDSEDAKVRQAAANTVGAWAVDGVLEDEVGAGIEEGRQRQRQKQVKLPVELMTKLADMVGTGEVGWAATNSFGAVARNNVRCVIKTFTSSRHSVLDRIAEQVDSSTTRSLVCVRALIFFYDTWMKQDEVSKAKLNWQGLKTHIEKDLVRELKILVEDNKVQRLRTQAAYLLCLIRPHEIAGSVAQHIQAIKPNKDEYWYRIEQQMLQYLLNTFHPTDPPLYPQDVRPTPNLELTPPLAHLTSVEIGTA